MLDDATNNNDEAGDVNLEIEEARAQIHNWKTPPEIERMTKVIYDHFVSAPDFDREIPYEEIKRLVGDVPKSAGTPQQKQVYAATLKARERFLSDHHILVKCVPGKGLRLLPPKRAIDAGASKLASIHNSARKNCRMLDNAVGPHLTDLSVNDQTRAQAVRSVAAIIAEVTRPRHLPAVEAAVTVNQQRQLPVEATLDVFKQQAERAAARKK